MIKKGVILLAFLLGFFILNESLLKDHLCAEVSKEKIEKTLPGNLKVDSLRFDEDLRLYEVVAQGRIFYLTENLRYLIIGNIIDLRTLKNLTANKIRDLRKVDFSSLPLGDAIKVSDGKRSIAVFTDPDCPYCKKLHVELSRLRDVSVYVFLFPISEEGKRKAIQVWCSEDKIKALDAAFNGGKLQGKLCENHPVERNLSLGRKLFISGTPTIITDKGEFVNGYVKAEVIIEALNKK